MRILGVDPGLSTAGVGLIEIDAKGLPKALDWLTITTSPALPLADRLLELATDLEGFLKDAKPDIAVVEELFFATNKRTAMDVSQARGVILVTLKKAGIEVRSATPLQLKTAISGDGQADKKQMQAMVKRILRLTEIPEPADAADALALALYGSYTLQRSGITSPSRTVQTARSSV
ncbi:MAG: crossover junction endodeoxyribonuclease RuvC [Candidatus Peribacteraceae bacterium]|nr:crossover junction endodeoxyribonuclease RuvC [Candidatus Peribacteraceae bacterium]